MFVLIANQWRHLTVWYEMCAMCVCVWIEIRITAFDSILRSMKPPRSSLELSSWHFVSYGILTSFSTKNKNGRTRRRAGDFN